MKKRETVTKEPESSLVADIRAMFAELAKEAKIRYAEADKRQAEYAKRQAEYAKRQAEYAKIEAERHAKADEEFRKWKEENDRITKEWNRRLGGMDENIGHHAEQFFQDSLAQTLTFGGEKYDNLIPNLRYVRKSENAEFDIVLVNGKSVAIIEVKNRIHPKNVKEMTEEKLVKFRKFFPLYQKHKVYLGLAGFSFSPKAREDALARGIGILKQVGDSVEVDAGHLKAY